MKLTILGRPPPTGTITGTTVGEVPPGAVVVITVHSVKPPVRVSIHAPGGRTVIVLVIKVSQPGGNPGGSDVDEGIDDDGAEGMGHDVVGEGGGECGRSTEEVVDDCVLGFGMSSEDVVGDELGGLGKFHDDDVVGDEISGTVRLPTSDDDVVGDVDNPPAEGCDNATDRVLGM